MTDNKPKLDLGLLEEDDEFEEFPVEGILLVIFDDLLISLTLMFRLDRKRKG